MITFSLKRISTVGPKSRGLLGSGGVRLLSQTRPIPRSPDGDKNTELLRGQFLDESGAVLVMDIALDQFSEFEEFSPQETLNLRSPISKSHLPISSAFHLSRSLSSLTKHSQNWDFDSHLGSWPQPFHIDCGAVSQMLQSS